MSARWTGRSPFDLGRLCITANAAKTLPAREVLQAVARHVSGDWGLLDPHDLCQIEDADGGAGTVTFVERLLHETGVLKALARPSWMP